MAHPGVSQERDRFSTPPWVRVEGFGFSARVVGRLDFRYQNDQKVGTICKFIGQSG